VVERHWPGLHELEYSSDPASNPFLRYGVNNWNREEVAAYTGLAWAFTGRCHRLAIPTWDRDAAIRYLQRQDYDLVSWEYRIEADETAWPDRDQGFAVPLVSLGPGANAWQRAHEHEAALFPVRHLSELNSLTTVILSDATGSLNVFGVSGSPDRLVDALRGASGRRSSPRTGGASPNTRRRWGRSGPSTTCSRRWTRCNVPVTTAQRPVDVSLPEFEPEEKHSGQCARGARAEGDHHGLAYGDVCGVGAR